MPVDKLRRSLLTALSPELANSICTPATICNLLSLNKSYKGVLCTANKKKGGGSARFHHSARCASKWRRPGLKQISRTCAWRLSRVTKFVFFSKVAPKIVRKRTKCKYQQICLQESSFLPPSFGIFCRAKVKHMLDMASDDEAALVEMCSSDSSESSDHTSDWVWSRWTVNFRFGEAVFCVVSSTAEKLIAQQRLKPDLWKCSRWPCWPCRVKGSPKRQRGLALPCHQRKKKKVESNRRSGAERIWTDDHRPSGAPKSAVCTAPAISESTTAWWKKSMESWSPPGSARFSVRKKCVVCFWQNLTKSKFSLFRLSNNLCCHWCWSLCSRTYPNPSKNTKSDPKSLTRIALHRISCGSASLTQVRPSPFWGAPRTVVKPRASSPLFFIGGTQHPLVLSRVHKNKSMQLSVVLLWMLSRQNSKFVITANVSLY